MSSGVYDELFTLFEETSKARRRYMTIADNNGPIILCGQNQVLSEDEKQLDKVDLRKIKEKMKDKPVDLDTEQFILVGLSPKESVIRKAKEEIHKFQVTMRGIVNDIWTLMDLDPFDGETAQDGLTRPKFTRCIDKKDYEGMDYSELQERLTELISSVERVKKKLY